MIVMLHGVPGDDNHMTLYEITEFQETIIVKVVPIPSIEVARIISPYKPLRPVEHEFTYRFSHHDGEHYHYHFVSSS